MGELTAPGLGPVDGAAAATGAGAATIGAAATVANAPARATRIRAPFCSTSISVRPVSAKRSDKARIASASMPGLLPDRRDFKSSLVLMSFFSFFLAWSPAMIAGPLGAQIWVSSGGIPIILGSMGPRQVEIRTVDDVYR